VKTEQDCQGKPDNGDGEKITASLGDNCFTYGVNSKGPAGAVTVFSIFVTPALGSHFAVSVFSDDECQDLITTFNPLSQEGDCIFNVYSPDGFRSHAFVAP
jgi:hypothetical protein